jgi:hypothetical protein
VADYGNDPSWRGRVTRMRLPQPGPAQAGRTTHELLRLLGMTFRAGGADRGPASCRFTEVVEGRLLGPSRPLEPLVAWLLQRQATAPA